MSAISTPQKTQRVALVTGAAKGIGRSIALHFAQDGFDVAITDLESSKKEGESVVREIEALGAKSVYIVADSSVKEDVSKAVQLTCDILGGFDVMVNNAGIAFLSPVTDVPPDLYHKIFNTNVGGVLYGTQAASKKFIELGQKGKIINACSIAGQEGLALHSLYCGSKFAIKGITQAASKELGPKGITVNAYCPGVTYTELWSGVEKQIENFKDLNPGQPTKDSAASAALRRCAEPEDVAKLVCFLASDKADFITGQAIMVDGGTVFR